MVNTGITIDYNNLDDEVKQKIIDPLNNQLEVLSKDLNEKETKLERLNKSILSKISKYPSSLAENIKKYTNYRKILIRIIIGSSFVFIGLVIYLGFDRSINWVIDNSSISNSSFSTSSKLLNIVSIFAFVIFWSALSVFYYNSQMLKEVKSLKEEEEKSLKDDEVDSKDSEKNKMNDLIEGFKITAIGTEAFFRNKISLFEDINKVVTFKREWSLKCENIETVISFFKLKELKVIVADLKNNPQYGLMGISDDKVIQSIINSICSKAFFDTRVMNLFVLYFNGNPKTKEEWEIIQTDNKLLGEVAKRLLAINIFNLYKKIDEVDINDIDLQQILAKTQNFEQSLITNNVLLYLRIRDFLFNYRKKLSEEMTNRELSKEIKKMIDLKKHLTNEEVIANINFKNDFASSFIDIFSIELHQYLNVDFKDAYVDALMAILLNPDINYRYQVCKRASNNDETIYVLIAYYNLRKKKGETNEQFFLFDIFGEAEKPFIIKKKIEDNDHLTELLFKRLHSALFNGEWYESSQTIMQSMVEEIIRKLDKNEKNETLIRIFTKYFTKININTLDRAVDAGLFTIYLILVPPTKGNFLPKVIDRLTVQEHEEMNEEKKVIKVHYETTKAGDLNRSFDIKKIDDFMNKYSVSLLLDPQTPKYDFEDYSNATRIGILHNTTPFLTFIDSFNKDVEMILRKEVEINPKTKWENITFIILRISPSKHSFGLMNDNIKNMDSVKFSNNLVLANKIAKLASPYLTEQQKTAVATFENDITLENIFEQLTLFDFMSPNKQKIYEKKYGDLLKSADLMISIKEYLKTCNIESFRHLSTRLFRHPEKQSELKEFLSLIIVKEYKKPKYKKKMYTEIDKDVEEFVFEFLGSIKALYDMWNHEILNP